MRKSSFGKSQFNKAIHAVNKTFKKWKDECIGEMTELRRAYIYEIVNHYENNFIPFKHFELYDIYSNELSYPLICACHLGYFKVLDDGLLVENHFLSKINDVSQEVLERVINKINKKNPEFYLEKSY